VSVDLEDIGTSSQVVEVNTQCFSLGDTTDLGLELGLERRATKTKLEYLKCQQRVELVVYY
jgi:hypothetical protein